MRVAVLQSNYIPWKGYFDLIDMVDVCVFYDDVQYTKNDWRNRNRVKTKNGAEWITIPCGSSIDRLICEVELKDHAWQKKHFKTLVNSYSKAMFFDELEEWMKSIYLDTQWRNLSDLNQQVIRQISENFLDINTSFDDSRNYNLSGKSTARLLDLLKQVGATHYLSGPAAKSYMDMKMFESSEISLEWMTYDKYPEYKQLYPPFESNVTVLDVIANTGPAARQYIKQA